MATPPSCRLCLVTPPGLTGDAQAAEAFAETLAAALSGGDVASVLLRGAEGEGLATAVAALRQPAQDAGAAFLIEGDAEAARRLGCDGAQVAGEPGVLRAARRALGTELILGADCGASRHLAMEAGELEADYVVFDAAEIETIAWWAELMEVPCVAAGGITLATAPALVAAGTDFLAVGRAVWEHPEGPAAAVAAFNALMARPA